MAVRWTARRRTAAALLASAALHLVLVLALPRGAPPRPARPASLAIELRPVERPRAEPSAPAPLPRERAVQGAAPPRRFAGAPRLTPPIGAPRGPAPAPPARGSAAWRAQEGLGAPPGAEPSLRPRLGSPGGAGAPAGGGELADAPQRDPSLPEDPEVAAARGKRRLDAWFADLKAIDRARVAPDAYWSKLRERLGAGPEVPWDVLGRGGGGAPRAIAGGFAEALAGYQAMAERWAATGSLGAAPSARADLARDGAGPAGASETARALLGPGASGGSFLGADLLALVSIVQGEDGALRTVELVRGSGNRVYDALVLARAQSLAADAPRQLGAPPGGERRTLWAFATRFELFPPIPVVGCGFDATFRPTGCFYPLKKSVRTRVSLQAVY